ncbi:MAG TPA: hypothetical protein VLH08_01210, partial [Acidobacteriota bacterium]|nr:hypothetical protein [Acidobacteriota bacterium]
MNSDRFFSMASIVTVMAFVLLVVGASSVLAADQTSHASAPMRVVSGGLTAEQQMVAQAELSKKLLNNLPSNAVAVPIPFTAEEAATIDASKSTVPLKIGLVKSISPRIEVRGQMVGRIPPREDGPVWATIFNSTNAGAIRLHVEDMSLPANTELYVYSRNGQSYGPYTGRGPDSTGEFWTATIFGAEAILQLHVLAAAAKSDLKGVLFRVRETGVITPRYASGTRDISQARPEAPAANWPCGNPNCVVDASCQGGPADPLSMAVAKMEWVQGAFI